MDTKRVGAFLAQLRKESNYTQEELGEIIGVTNKTISRWENGNYMPPVDMLLRLSNLYQISINEIVSGCKLHKDEYQNEAENNIVTALENIEINNKRMEKICCTFLGFISILTVFLMILLGRIVSRNFILEGIIIIIGIMLLAFLANTFVLTLLAVSKKGEKYEIKKYSNRRK